MDAFLKNLLLCFCLISIAQCTIFDPSYYSEAEKPKTYVNAQSNKNPNAEAGKCYAKCLINSEEEHERIQICVYTGNDEEAKGVERQRIITKEGGTKWIKKQADKNCISENVEDCLVWCLVSQEEEYIDKLVVTDTSLVKDFRMEQFFVTSIKDEATISEWKEVICSQDVTTDLCIQLKEKLKSTGFYQLGLDEESDRLTSSVKNALKAYQLAHKLPFGSLDIETLEHMGIYVY